MGYISDHLCHFVGRSCLNDDARFELLVKIIREQQLKANLLDPSKPEVRTSNRYSGDRLGEIFERCDCVCFCDIPDDMLDIHTSKYSRFGMGFNKAFLSARGARPVMYVPLGVKMNEPTDTDNSKDSPIDYYLYLSKLANNLNTLLMLVNGFFPFNQQLALSSTKNSNVQDVLKLLDKEITLSFLQGKAHQMIFSETIALSKQCAYVKVFDENLAEDDPDNYYMEREWRSLKSIDFTPADIRKVYLPSQHYKEMFLTEFPDYAGEFWLFDEQLRGRLDADKKNW